MQSEPQLVVSVGLGEEAGGCSTARIGVIRTDMAAWQSTINE